MTRYFRCLSSCLESFAFARKIPVAMMKPTVCKPWAFCLRQSRCSFVVQASRMEKEAFMLLGNMLWEYESGRLVLHAMPLLLIVLCALTIAYRYYSAFLAAKVMALDDSRK